MADSTAKIWTVSEVNRMVKETLEQSFYPFWLGAIASRRQRRCGRSEIATVLYVRIRCEFGVGLAVLKRGGIGAEDVEKLSGIRGPAVPGGGAPASFLRRPTWPSPVGYVAILSDDGPTR